MWYSVKKFTDKKAWNDFVINNFSFYSFLDSWQWWEFQEIDWNEVIRLWVYFDNDLIWLFQIIFVKARRWNFFFIPHWPLIKEKYFEALKYSISEIQKYAKEKWACFIRLNSISEHSIQNKNNYKKLWFINAPMHMHAENTHLLDLTKSKDELKANLRKTTRYLINRAQKEWVIIETNKSKESVDNLIHLHQLHAKRSNGKLHYSAFSSKYIYSLLKIFGDNATVLNAIYDWYTEASLMTIRFGKTCVYYIWASDIRNPKFSPAYLLQWSAVMKAKEEWCLFYNFWWVSPDNNPKHPIQWVTLFKRGFWWYDFDLLHAQDYVFNWAKYLVNYWVETVRRLKRGYYYKKFK